MVCPESENNGRNQAKLNFENDQSLWSRHITILRRRQISREIFAM
jgi:hypothetical protein